jgi:CTP synthase
MKSHDFAQDIKLRDIKTKFIILSGGVCSSIGKGVLNSALGVLLKSAGRTVSVMKMDPYLNVDPGTMSPLVHGEVFVTKDGAETDLDLGHYERMLDINLTRESSVSAGQIFAQVLEGERKGKYLGRCIQLVPHVVDAIKQRLIDFALKHKPDVLLVEIGGTVGDMEGEVFLEAFRQFKMDLGSENVVHCHLSYVPYLAWANEAKTKPTQHSIMLLKKAGIVPDVLFLRIEQPLDEATVRKVAVMCGVAQDFIFQVPTYSPVYKLFVDLKKQDLHVRMQKRLGLEVLDSDLSAWEDLISRIEHKKPVLRIGLIAKYVGANDPYISVLAAIKSAAWACGKETQIIEISAEKLEDTSPSNPEYKKLADVDGIVVPGGFDSRGFEGKVRAATYAREHAIPYLGLCLGLQALLVEAARSLAYVKGATSTEMQPNTLEPVISLLKEQRGLDHKGASMRLGAYPCSLVPGTKAFAAYGEPEVMERHRHRYEFNNAYRERLEASGVVFSGIYKEQNLIEIAEIKGHPFMVGVQFHPEFLSRPLRPHPLFKAFIEAIVAR